MWAEMTMKPRCPRCQSSRITDGSSRWITVFGTIVVAVSLFVLFGLCCPHQINDWSHYVAFEEHDSRALLGIVLGIVMVVGGSMHPDTLYCEACSHKWERNGRPKVQLRSTGRPPRH